MTEEAYFPFTYPHTFIIITIIIIIDIMLVIYFFFPLLFFDLLTYLEYLELDDKLKALKTNLLQPPLTMTTPM